MPRSFRSATTLDDDGLRLALAPALTPEGPVTDPAFFHGFATRPQVLARCLLALADITATRYVRPATLQFHDPVLSAHGDRLRAEVFSACNGVHACLEVLGEALDGGRIGRGTTNVDISADTRRLLSSVRRTELLHLDVGDEGMRASTPTAHAHERPVRMPGRWLRALGNVAEIHRGMETRFELSAQAARSFVASLPSSTSASVSGRLVPHGDGVRLEPGTGNRLGAVHVAGLQRLVGLKPLLVHVRSMTFHAPRGADGEESACAVVVTLPGMRLTLGLTATPWRGYSGEGSLLEHVTGPRAEADARLLNALLAFESVIDVGLLARRAHLEADRVHAALAVLAASGRVGWDLTEGAYFHRELPTDPERLETDNPRLRRARKLVRDGAVHHVGRDRYEVSASGRRHTLWVPPGPAEQAVAASSCTCAWGLRHGTDRGPCAHVLAVLITRGTVTDDQEQA